MSGLSIRALILLAMAGVVPAGAVTVSGGYQTSDPGLLTTTGVSAWNYVGTLGGAGGFYLGNGWALTAGHIGASIGETYSLQGNLYTVTSSAQVGSADLTLFQITGNTQAANDYLAFLGSLTLPSSSPAINDPVLMLGFGNGGAGAETWGIAPVVVTNFIVTDIGTYITNDYITYDGGSTYVVPRDSGGAGFVYNSLTGNWELSGVLEAQVSSTDSNGTTYGSGLVDLSVYASDITAIEAAAVPEPDAGAMLGLGGVLVLAVCLGNRRLLRPPLG